MSARLPITVDEARSAGLDAGEAGFPACYNPLLRMGRHSLESAWQEGWAMGMVVYRAREDGAEVIGGARGLFFGLQEGAGI